MEQAWPEARVKAMQFVSEMRVSDIFPVHREDSGQNCHPAMGTLCSLKSIRILQYKTDLLHIEK